MIGKISTCKHQDEYDSYIATHNIYTFNENWGINVSELAKFIKENHIKTEEINEAFLEQFRVH